MSDRLLGIALGAYVCVTLVVPLLRGSAGPGFAHHAGVVIVAVVVAGVVARQLPRRR